MNRLLPRSALRSISLFSGAFGATAKMDSKPMSVQAYSPKEPNRPFPYTKADLTPMDAGNDSEFYVPPRFVTHIDDNAIIQLKGYYDSNLPRKGRVLDFCSSWISHYPPDVTKAAEAGDLEVLGTGMNESELRRNPVLKAYTVQDLNENPEVKLPGDVGGALDASTCVVSIDYLTKPVDVLTSIRRQTNEGGKVHLAISNRCFPTKAVGRWLRITEAERLKMVGDYLWYAGWRDIEIVTVVEPGSWLNDPLWVVRATKVSDT